MDMDIATKVYETTGFKPIVNSLMDTDFYKLLMHQFIWANYINTNVTFETKNRTKRVFLMDTIDLKELQAQLEHVKGLHIKKSEIISLRGSEFAGMKNVFSEGYLDYLHHTFALSDYSIDIREGNLLVLSFEGSWVATTLWEIYSMTIINEMRYRKIMSTMKQSQLDLMYSKAKVKLHAKLERIKANPSIKVTDFGTRRRHSHDWQEYVIQTAIEVLGEQFAGTSNVYFAQKYDLAAIGTNAHELPMVFGALAKNDDELKQSQYKVLQQWQNMYRGRLLCFLPDTFGTTQFLKNAPVWLDNWVAARPDSKPPIEGGEELIKFWGKSAPNKTIVFSDGLDVSIGGYTTNGDDIVEIFEHFEGRVGMAFGWGTNLTNDFRDCAPVTASASMSMSPISLVCKVKSANDHPAVKLSDNAAKRTGDPIEVERYVRVFGEEGMSNVETKV